MIARESEMNRMKITSIMVLLTCLISSPAFASPLRVPDPGLVAIDTPRSEANALTAMMPNGPTDPEEFEAFLDPLVTDLMKGNHILGGAITVVKDGQTFFAKGYVYGDVKRGTPATADTTIFRTGSISKVFTWLYVNSGGNIILTTLLPAAQSFFVIVNEGITLEQQIWLLAAVYLATALIVAMVTGPSLTIKSVDGITPVVNALRGEQPLARK